MVLEPPRATDPGPEWPVIKRTAACTGAGLSIETYLSSQEEISWLLQIRNSDNKSGEGSDDFRNDVRFMFAKEF